MSQNKTLYILLCEKEKTIPIFMQPWWLDAVCKSDNIEWDVALTLNKQKEIIAALAYAIQKKWGFTRITVPHLTKFTGIWQRPILYTTQHENANEEQSRIINLLSQLPDNHYITLQLHPNLTDHSVFTWAGFNIEMRYIQILPDLSNIEAVYENVNRNTKRNIKKANSYFKIEEKDDLDTFLKLQNTVFERQNRQCPTPPPIWRNIDAILIEKKQRKIYFSMDENGEAQGSFYMVWDNETAYALANGVTEYGREKGAITQLTWQAIKDASTMGLSFNFLGSMLPTVEAFNRGFNTIKKPYFVVTKSKNRLIDLSYNMIRK